MHNQYIYVYYNIICNIIYMYIITYITILYMQNTYMTHVKYDVLNIHLNLEELHKTIKFKGSWMVEPL